MYPWRLFAKTCKQCRYEPYTHVYALVIINICDQYGIEYQVVSGVRVVQNDVNLLRGETNAQLQGMDLTLQDINLMLQGMNLRLYAEQVSPEAPRTCTSS